MGKFYTSDTHFNEQRSFDMSMRGMYFDSLEHSTLAMIKRWNETVSPEDTVYHLGDFGDFEVARYLNGNIVLLYGNYERDGQVPTPEQEKYFTRIEKGLYIEENYFLTHEPGNIRNIESEILHHNFGFGDVFYLFGHIHEKQKVKRNGLNVGVDVHNFTPVNVETTEFYRKAIKDIYDDNVFENFG